MIQGNEYENFFYKIGNSRQEKGIYSSKVVKGNTKFSNVESKVVSGKNLNSLLQQYGVNLHLGINDEKVIKKIR